MEQNTRILEITASVRRDESISRTLTTDLVTALEQRYPDAEITRRDISAGLPFFNNDNAATLADDLIAELQSADVLVIGAPIYNFSIPATLKAWIDLVAQAGVTFRYTENGPEGLLKNKKAWVLVSSGGVPVGSPADFATPYLRHVLAFIGITDVEFIGAAGADRGNDVALDEARAQIADSVHLSSLAA